MVGQGSTGAPKILRLDVLPDEALVNILRHLSARPRTKDWRLSVKAEALSPLLRLGGVIASAIQDEFAELKLTGVSGDIIITDLEAGKRQYLRRVHLLVSMVGPRLIRLDLQSFWKCFAQWIGAYCTSLRHLSVSSSPGPDAASLSVLLKKCGPMLEVLEFDKESFLEEDIAVIAKNCTALFRLKLASRRLLTPLHPLWKGVGRNLLHLELDGMDSPPRFFELDELGAECTNLSSLAFIVNVELGTELVDFFVHRGAGLQSVVLSQDHHLWAEHFQAISDACSSAEISVHGVGVNADCVVALGSTASHLIIPKDFYEDKDAPVVENLDRISRACPNLKSCDCRSDIISLDALRALFLEPKPRLVRFNLNTWWTATSPANVFQVLAEKVSSLEEFEYCGPAPPVELVESFVAANKSLRSVCFQVATRYSCTCYQSDTVRRSGLVDWRKIVHIFLGCKYLSLLNVGCTVGDDYDAERATMCLPGRVRGITMSVCGYTYS